METVETKDSGQLRKLKALSDETRLGIINLLSAGPLCACDILQHHAAHIELSYEAAHTQWSCLIAEDGEMDPLLPGKGRNG
ncbi:MAG: ArsR family transcriptional regulator [Sphaerochaeta sp.]|nr:ArsR family transcriptional regulator [Sphaerochaeta sp.]